MIPTSTLPLKLARKKRRVLGAVISLLQNATDTDTRDVSVDEVLDGIRTGGENLKGRIQQIRNRFECELAFTSDRAKAKLAIDALKKQLPAVMWSGTFSSREKPVSDKLIAHSGLLCADLDSLNGELPAVREKLSESPHLCALFKSPSGDGLKAVFRVPADASKHLASFRALQKHIRELTGCEIDESGKDLARLCFVSHDPDLHVQLHAREITPLPEPLRLKRKLNSNGGINLSERQRIAVELLGEVDWQSETSGFVTCPGKHLHTTGNNERDCKVELDSVPTAHCFHNSCRGILDGVNHELRSRTAKLEHKHAGLDEAGGQPSDAGQDAIIARLAALPRLEYERVRKDEAKKLNCRQSILDKQVEAERSRSRTTTEPRPEKSIQALLESQLPKIQLPGDDRLLSAFAFDLGAILKDHGLYQRGGVAMIVNDERDGLEVITPAMLRTLVERSLVCYRIIDAGEGRTAEFFKTMSTDAAQGVLSAKQFLSCLPKIDRIATTRLPIMRPNGVIELLPDGYDPQSMTLTLSQCDYDETLSMKEARAVIDDLFSEFPFADSGRSNAVAIAAAVGLYASGLIDRKTLRPVFIYIGNAEGAGKTLLAICAITPTHGEAKIDSKLDDQTETKKELLAAVIEARPYVLFDNIKGHLNSPALEGFTTSTRFSGRILGVSRTFSGQNIMTVFITGNGCTVSPDMRRRSLFVELRMEEEHAEERVFERELDQKVLLDLRPHILAALWAFVREWDKAGRRNPSRTHNAFPEWSRTIGGIVEFAGYRCPFEIAEIDDAADLDGADMHELVKLISECEAESLTFDELVSLSRDHGLFERIIGNDDVALKPAERSKLGKLLKRYDRRLFAQGRFFIDGKGRHRKYRVAQIT
jgi:hypothetical protein